MESSLYIPTLDWYIREFFLSKIRYNGKKQKRGAENGI